MTITIETIQARHTEISAMIEQLQAQIRAQAPRTIALGETIIELQPGERYAGTVLDEAGNLKHHLILMAARPEDRLSWNDAMTWAASIGGALPDRQEQALLYANCKPHLEGTWHWSCQAHEEEASYAWRCYFYDGNQGLSHESYEGCAVAVRRLTPSVL